MLPPGSHRQKAASRPGVTRRWRRGLIGAFATLVLVLGATPAYAHTGEQSEEASQLVRQAIAIIVNKPSDRMGIEDKINDALDSKVPEGVNLDLVRQAKTAFDAGDLHMTRGYLEESIGARPHLGSGLPVAIGQSPPTTSTTEAATGEETGTNIASDPLVVHRHFDGRTTTMLVVAIVLLAAGAALAVRYRPAHPLGHGRVPAKEA